MPRLYNADSAAVVVHHNLPAIQPGEPCDFSDEQVENGLGGLWTSKKPGTSASKKKAAAPSTEPDAEPDTDKEE